MANRIWSISLHLYIKFFNVNYILVWFVCGLTWSPTILAHGEQKPAENLSYCGFLTNESLPYLPEEWNVRWDNSIFTVSKIQNGCKRIIIIIIFTLTLTEKFLWYDSISKKLSATLYFSWSPYLAVSQAFNILCYMTLKEYYFK